MIILRCVVAYSKWSGRKAFVIYGFLCFQDKEADTQTVDKDMPFGAINSNDNRRIRKKCNLDSSFKRVNIIEDVVITNLTKIKSCEPLETGTNTLVLSPSKLNASKRSLVEIANVNESFIRNAVGNLPKCNALPTLETPVKFDPLFFPKTPDLSRSVGEVDTPFANALLADLGDLSDIPTPKFPITPCFSDTPVAESARPAYPRCPTDYSTSSSYYHPSDSEQNKSLEQVMEECNRIEKPHTSEVSKKDQRVPKKRGKKKNEIEASQKSAQEKLNVFNIQMVGKKNLNLLKCPDYREAASSTSSSSTSCSESDSTDTSIDNFANKTIIDNRQEAYSLRPRRSARNTEGNYNFGLVVLHDNLNNYFNAIYKSMTNFLFPGYKFTVNVYSLLK